MGVLLDILPVVFLAAAFADILPNASECGTQILSAHTSLLRIVGGDETSYGEYPWLAALQYNLRSSDIDAGIRCGGFLINKRFVVTAAHCLFLENLELNRVYLGVRKISEIETNDVDKVRKHEIEQIIKHEDYYPCDTVINDIALLKLNTEVKYSDYIRPICLPDADAALPAGGTNLWVAGWGRIIPNGKRADYKLKVKVPIHSYEVCENKLNRTLRSDQFCAEGELQRGTCGGDGGAPLMHRVPDGIDLKWTAVGIVSSDNGCGFQGIPVVHTRVSSYIPWIMEKLYGS